MAERGGRRCVICTRLDPEERRALEADVVAGKTDHSIAAMFNLSGQQRVEHHRTRCMPPRMWEASKAGDLLSAEGLHDIANRSIGALLRTLDRVERGGAKDVVAVAAELRNWHERGHKLLGDLIDRQAVTMSSEAEAAMLTRFAELAATALADHPGAVEALADALIDSAER